MLVNGQQVFEKCIKSFLVKAEVRIGYSFQIPI